MKLKIDLKIFLITFLFFMTSQIKIYITMMICAILHELGHLIMGIILGMKPEKLEIIPIGIRITFKLNIKDINKKVKKANKLEIKKILIAIAGPAINILLIIISATTKINIIAKINFIYANLLLAIINLVPIYPLRRKNFKRNNNNFQRKTKRRTNHKHNINNINNNNNNNRNNSSNQQQKHSNNIFYNIYMGNSNKRK